MDRRRLLLISPSLGLAFLCRLVSWDLHEQVNLLVGYSHFFAGAFFRTNPSPPPYGGDADFFYTQLTLRF